MNPRIPVAEVDEQIGKQHADDLALTAIIALVAELTVGLLILVRCAWYGYRFGDAGPHPNKAHAAWGRRAHRLEPDPVKAPLVTWIFVQRLAGHSAAFRVASCPPPPDHPVAPHRPWHGQALVISSSSTGSAPGECSIPPLAG